MMKRIMKFLEEGIVPSHVKGGEGRGGEGSHSHIPTCEDGKFLISEPPVSPSFDCDRGGCVDASVAGLLKSKFNITH